MKTKLVAALAIMLGIVLILLAMYYWRVPAGQLPMWVPGYEMNSGTIHVKHGIGSLFLGLAAFAFAWFYTGGQTQK